MPKQPSVQQISQPLLGWYRANARQLPWRENHDPYRVWVSEIMLQQTRVEAVKPYYRRFLERLPNVAALAAVPEEELMKLWEGLGYYSRVRNMQKAARIVMEQYGGKMPDTPAALKKLPGIGDYTAGEVASIAFGCRAACVDGNVLRVFARLRNDDTDITLPRVKAELADEISRGMPDCPGDFNQALMELGAIVCLPGGEPLCGQCPLGELCRGRAAGRQTALPVKAAKPDRQISRLLVLVLRDARGRVALRRRTVGPLKGMWELPTFAAEGQTCAAQAEQLAAGLGFSVSADRPLGESRHVFTHREWHMQGWLLQSETDFAAPPEGWAFAAPQELQEEYALPAAFRAYRVWEQE